MRSFSHILLWMLILLSPLSTVLSAESLSRFEDSKTNLWGYRASSGRVIIRPQFIVAEDFSPYGLAAVADNSGWKYIDLDGKIIILPFVFDNGPDPFQQGLARFRLDGKFGFFDERGQVVIPAHFDFAASFSEDLAAFCQGCRQRKEGEHGFFEGGKWGFIDRTGLQVISPIFEDARPFENGKARVMLDGHWISIDKKGNRLP